MHETVWKLWKTWWFLWITFTVPERSMCSPFQQHFIHDNWLLLSGDMALWILVGHKNETFSVLGKCKIIHSRYILYIAEASKGAAKGIGENLLGNTKRKLNIVARTGYTAFNIGSEASKLTFNQNVFKAIVIRASGPHVEEFVVRTYRVCWWFNVALKHMNTK